MPDPAAQQQWGWSTAITKLSSEQLCSRALTAAHIHYPADIPLGDSRCCPTQHKQARAWSTHLCLFLLLQVNQAVNKVISAAVPLPAAIAIPMSASLEVNAQTRDGEHAYSSMTHQTLAVFKQQP